MEMTDREELMQDAETGRRCKIAMEVLKGFLTERKNDIISILENERYTYECEENILRDSLAELRVMRGIQIAAEDYIQRGEIAEEELSHGE